MTVLPIEPTLDRYLAAVQIGQNEWSAKEVEALLLKLREDILECLK
jgi:hypothetical protein